MNIAGMNKAAVLAALYNAARPQGMGFLQYDPKPMTEQEAQQILDSGETYFDYLKGRVMKIDLKGEEIDPRWYNWDNGSDMAETAVELLRSSGHTNAPGIAATHKAGKLDAAAQVMSHLTEETRMSEPGILILGLAEVADELSPAVNKALED